MSRCIVICQFALNSHAPCFMSFFSINPYTLDLVGIFVIVSSRSNFLFESVWYRVRCGISARTRPGVEFVASCVVGAA